MFTCSSLFLTSVYFWFRERYPLRIFNVLQRNWVRTSLTKKFKRWLKKQTGTVSWSSSWHTSFGFGTCMLYKVFIWTGVTCWMSFGNWSGSQLRAFLSIPEMRNEVNIMSIGHLSFFFICEFEKLWPFWTDVCWRVVLMPSSQFSKFTIYNTNGV